MPGEPAPANGGEGGAPGPTEAAAPAEGGGESATGRPAEEEQEEEEEDPPKLLERHGVKSWTEFF
eukprot:9253675-Alexandrium_andersonii.AAC.1